MMKKLIPTILALALIALPASAAEQPLHQYIRTQCELEFGSKAIAKEKADYYAPLITKYATRYGLPPEVVAAVVWHESNFRPRCTSSCNAQGLMQVIPFAGRFPAGSDHYDPDVNLNAGCKLLKGYLLEFHGDWPRALAAYNWGPANVSRGTYRLDYSRAVLKSAGHAR
jgi:soluble lytic murein transglycosylase-like protein